MNNNEWYPLETSANIYPAIMSPKQASVFRLSCTLKEDVDPDILRTALDVTIQRYPTFCVMLKKGAFWFYFEGNENEPKLRQESVYPCQMIEPDKNRGFLFQISWFQRRINLEVFHVVADGTGGIEFLKTLVYYYLLLSGKNVLAGEHVRTLAQKPSVEERENAFLRYYDPLIEANRAEDKAWHFYGTALPPFQSRAIHAQIGVQELLQLTHQAGVSITEYLTAIFIYSYFQQVSPPKDMNEQVRVSVPINLRKLFPSDTLRNFTFFINIGERFVNKDQPFAQLLRGVHDQMQELYCRESVLPKMNPNVTACNNLLMRSAPLEMKQVALRQAHRMMGDDLFTCTLSNMGAIQMHESVNPYIDYFDFGLSTSERIPLCCSLCSFNDVLRLTFSSSIKERMIEREFIRFLSAAGLYIQIQTSEHDADLHVIESAGANALL